VPTADQGACGNVCVTPDEPIFKHVQAECPLRGRARMLCTTDKHEAGSLFLRMLTSVYRDGRHGGPGKVHP
jgi:hypothetical protein